PRPGGTAPAIAGELLAATGLWATRVNSRLTDLQVAAAATAATRPDRQRIAAALLAARTRVPELLASGRPIEAYALATATERMALAWNARSEAVRGASTAASAATVTQTLAQASTSVAARAADAVTTGAQTQVTSVEQLAALPVALTWGADAYAEAVDAGDRVDESRQSPMRADVLGEVAADLARAEYDLATYMPDSLTAATMSAGHPTLDASLATLGVYADALAQAGSANLAYLDSMGADDDRTVSPEASIARALADRWPTLSTDSAQGPIVTRLTTALSYFVASATAVARADAPPTSPTNRNAALIDPSAFSTQVAVATDETALTAGTLAGQGVGTSFLQWNDAVGRDLATAPDAASITDPISLDGLQVQWYANVQGKILGVLSADAD
ncbi:MAG: Lon proteolytic protein, partial [Actinomycetota bacterium]|nr:Lon proteolytic protein [Actinomycetota bacterium]